MANTPDDLNYNHYHEHFPKQADPKKPVWFWLLTVIVLILIAGAVYWFGFRKAEPNSGQSDTQTQQNIPATRAGNSP